MKISYLKSKLEKNEKFSNFFIIYKYLHAKYIRKTP
jgi:hypothetical protein